jgi:predicted RNA-binding Zn ribbon-like protein
MLRIVGGHPALDLVNTVAPRGPQGEEFLAAPADLLSWAGRVRLVEPGETASVSPAAWAAAVEIREATYAVLTDSADTGAALRTLQSRWADAISRARLEPASPGARLIVGTSDDMLIPDRLAHAAIDLLLNADLARLRVCPPDEGGCGWLFLDRSRNGSRRWCAMADCGTHAKSRRLTARRRTDRATSRSAEAG